MVTKFPKLPLRPEWVDTIKAIVISIAVGVILILVINQQKSNDLQLQKLTVITQQQKATLDSLASNSKQRTAQINELQNHIDCIVELFQQPNRSDLVLDDLQTCHLTATGAAVSATPVSPASTSSPPKVSQATTPTPQSQPATSSSSSSPVPPASPPSSPSTPSNPGLVRQVLNFLGL